MLSQHKLPKLEKSQHLYNFFRTNHVLACGCVQAFILLDLILITPVDSSPIIGLYECVYSSDISSSYSIIKTFSE